MGGVGTQFSKVAVMAAALAALCLSGCPATRRAPPVAPAVPATPLPGAEAAAPAGARRYRVVADESLVAIVTRSAGPLGALGHNHVIASRNLAGFIDVREPLTASSFEVRMPADLLTVDEPSLRAGRGPDFATEVPGPAREGTRRNLLGESLLDSAHYPAVVARAVALTGGPQAFQARVEFTVRSERRVIELPVRVVSDAAGALHVAARFTVAQSTLGLEPFSALLGALQVEDALAIEVDLIARQAP